MYVYDAEGKRTEASAKNAKEMVACGDFTTRWPKGTPEEELNDLQAAEKKDEQNEADDLLRQQDAARVAEERGQLPPGTTVKEEPQPLAGDLAVEKVDRPKRGTRIGPMPE